MLYELGNIFIFANENVVVVFSACYDFRQRLNYNKLYHKYEYIVIYHQEKWPARVILNRENQECRPQGVPLRG